MPLILTPKDFDAWLDPNLTDTDVFADLMRTHLSVKLQAIPIKSPQSLEPTGDPIFFPED
nr:SOS response-associated peptidase [Permianibacter aggregans]